MFNCALTFDQKTLQGTTSKTSITSQSTTGLSNHISKWNNLLLCCVNQFIDDMYREKRYGIVNMTKALNKGFSVEKGVSEVL